MRNHFFWRDSVLFFIKKNLILFSLFILISGCSKDESSEGSEKTTESFILNNDQLRPLQIASVYFSEETISSSEFYGSLGDHDVTFQKINENTLAFIVPQEIAPGNVELQLKVNGTDYVAEASILENIGFTDPQLVYEEFYQKYSADEFFNVDVQRLDEAKAKFQSLSEEEKLVAAQMLINNKQLLDDLNFALKNFYSGFTNSSPANSQTKMMQSDKLATLGLAVAFLGAAIGSPVVAAVGAGVVVGLALEVVVDSFKIIMDAVMPKITQGLEMAYGLGYNRMAYIADLVYDEADKRIFNKQQELPNEIVLREKETLNLSIELVTTPLVSEQNRDEYSIVDELLDSISKLREMLSNYYEVPFPPQEEFKQFAESLENFSVSVDNSDVEVSELTGSPESASVYFETEKLEDQEFNFTYSYTNEEGETSSFSQGIKLDVGYSVVFLGGSGIPSPLEWINNKPKSFKIIDYKGDDLDNFDISKLSVQNVSKNDVYFQVQKNGVFNEESGGEYFEIIPLTDEEEVEVSFDLFYDGVQVATINTVIVASGDNGIILNGTFYPLSYVYVDYNIGIIEHEDYSYVRYGHAVIFSPEPIDFNNPDFEYYLEGVLISDQPGSLPAGEYEFNIGGFVMGKDIYADNFSFNIGTNDYSLGSIYEVTETDSTTYYDWKKRGFINLDWDGNQTSFDFHVYNEQEELVDGFVITEMIEVELSVYD